MGYKKFVGVDHGQPGFDSTVEAVGYFKNGKGYITSVRVTNPATPEKGSE